MRNLGDDLFGPVLPSPSEAWEQGRIAGLEEGAARLRLARDAYDPTHKEGKRYASTFRIAADMLTALAALPKEPPF